jgi:hypothetical protein
VGCFALHGEGTVFLGLRRSLGWHGICAFEVGEEDKNWTGPDQEWRNAYTGCKDWNRTGIHKNQNVLYEDCKGYVWEFGRHSASAGAENTFIFCQDSS